MLKIEYPADSSLATLPSPKRDSITNEIQHSRDFNAVLDRLNGDWMFIEAFLDNPDAALSEYNLTEVEKTALTARDPEALMGLGVSEEAAQMALSGAHSQGCSTTGR